MEVYSELDCCQQVEKSETYKYPRNCPPLHIRAGRHMPNLASSHLQRHRLLIMTDDSCYTKPNPDYFVLLRYVINVSRQKCSCLRLKKADHFVRVATPMGLPQCEHAHAPTHLSSFTESSRRNSSPSPVSLPQTMHIRIMKIPRS